MGVQLAWQAEWRLPVGCDYSGFFVEVALGFFPAIAALVPGWRRSLRLAHGPCPDAFVATLAPAERRAYAAATTGAAFEDVDVVIEHGEPPWECRLKKSTVAFRVARALSEGMPAKSQVDCWNNHANEVWVPSAQHKSFFAESGVSKEKLRVIAEAVDPELWDPLALRSVRCDGAAAEASGPAIP